MGPVHDLSLIFLIGFLLDAVIGDPQSPLHPVALFGRYAGFLERKIRPLAGNGRVSGGIAWIAATLPVTVLAGVAGWGLGVFGAGACLFVSIALRSLLEHADAIRIPLQKGDLEGGAQRAGADRQPQNGESDGVGGGARRDRESQREFDRCGDKSLFLVRDRLFAGRCARSGGGKCVSACGQHA